MSDTQPPSSPFPASPPELHSPEPAVPEPVVTEPPAGPAHLAVTQPSFFQYAKKAFFAAIAAAIIATTPVILGDAAGGFTQEEIIACVGVFVTALVVGFFATFAPTNTPRS
jgi:hypothetical protein